MKISQLLATHHAILARARLANLAAAYLTLRRVAERVQRARLRGLVNLRQPDAETGRLWATLTALEGSQAVLEEHFRDEDLLDFADAAAFHRGVDNLDVTFRLETVAALFAGPVEAELRRSGVEFDLDGSGGLRPSCDPATPRTVDPHQGKTPNQR